jgi:hypothetical protein
MVAMVFYAARADDRVGLISMLGLIKVAVMDA